MFERFSEPARLAVVYAQEESRELRHDDIGAEHVLLGVVRVDGALVPRPAHEVREQVVALRPIGEAATRGQIPFTAQATSALEWALREALAQGHRHIGAGHLLAGLVAQPGAAIEVLEALGLDPATLRDAAIARESKEAPHRVARRIPRPQGVGAPARVEMNLQAPPDNPAEALREGHPVPVTLGSDAPMGDLGNPLVDGRLLLLILASDSYVGRLLRDHGLDEAAVRAAVPEL